jgi:hypothetical protein
MDFSTKLAQTREYATLNQLGVDSQEVYNEGILQAIEKTNPTTLFQDVETFIITNNYTIGAGYYYSYSLSFSSDFSGTMQGTTIQPNTIINLSAKTVLNAVNIDVITGSVLFVAIVN